MTIREMTLEDYERVITLWKDSPGVELSHADERENIAMFLERNPGLSLVAYDGDELVGTVLCGQDGRRGYLHHVAVNVSHRLQGIGQHLVSQAIARLRQLGIDKCHLFVVKNNTEALAFWEKIGWKERVELVMMSRMTSSEGRNYLP